MRRKVFICAAVLLIISLIAYAGLRRRDFAPAADFPPGALVYVQIEDLPALIRLWNSSEVKNKYLESRNFKDFSERHLGRKLFSRWQEFNAAAGFDLDAETVSAFSRTGAAVAFYDIGRLEFVFIAPVSAEVFAATRLFQNRHRFTGKTLVGGGEVFRAEVEADRGRQRQELLFTHARDRLIVATSEKLLAATLKNVAGGGSAGRLIDEPAFAGLKDKIAPRAASVWVDQAALNEDYYFRRYWLMSGVEDLKNIRAGVFDFEIAGDKLVERRRFLLKENTAAAPVEAAAAEEILAFAPEKVPFYRLTKASPERVERAVRQTFFPRRTPDDAARQSAYRHYPSDDDYGGYEYYGRLGEKYDETIDGGEDDLEAPERRPPADLAEVFGSAGSRAVLTFAEPEVLPAPLFVRFRRAAVFRLDAPRRFDRRKFEAVVAREFLRLAAVENSGARLEWEHALDDGSAPQRRQLRLPMAGIEATYAFSGNHLILANDGRYLSGILAAGNTRKFETGFAELTAIDLGAKEAVFENVFQALGENAAADFFTGNISSLLAAGGVRRIEIRKNYSGKILAEEIVFYLDRE